MSSSSNSSTLTKKQRGRFKKLRKRIQEVKEGAETCGLVSPLDWTEWQELMLAAANDNETAPLDVGPSVRLRRSKQQQQNAEGSDNRDVLWNIIKFMTLSSRKRKRKESLPRIPPWACLHNPCTTQSVAVVEVCLNTNDCTWNEIQQHLPILSSTLLKDKSKVVLPVQSRWFQGHQPKSISDVLMYLPRSSKTSESDTTGAEDDDVSGKDLRKIVGRLEDLVLSRKLRKSEGFPMADHTDKRKVNRNRDSFTNGGLRLPSLKAAKESVQKFSVPIGDGDEDEIFVATCTAETNESTDSLPRVFAVDCEMVKTSKGAELARITLLELTGVEQKPDKDVVYRVVMDEFVKPHEPVLDHVTEYSGVTAAILKDVSTRIEQIQAIMVEIVDKNDILIGHSLENDLRALRLVHDKVVDTAMVFRAKKGRRKYSLRHLSATLLGKQIQSSHGEDGHCSEEDAAAALNLAVRRAREGESFRIRERGDEQFHLLERIQEGSVVCVGPSDWLQQHVTSFPNSANALTCETIADPNRKAVVAWLSSPKRRAKLVWAKLASDPKDSDEAMLTKTNDFLSEVVERMLTGTLLLVCIQTGHAKVMDEAKKRKVCMDPRSSLGWSPQQEGNYQRLADQCRSGMAFWIGDSCC